MVIPCYNEEDIFPISCALFLNELYDLIKGNKIDSNSKILFFNDGSKDEIWNIVFGIKERLILVQGLLSIN